tara:strand:- start:365 stop:1513 length:1149 start_codon:yes stop_codon:yes gene_type:complete
MEMKTKIVIIFAAIFLVLLSANLASAEFWGCFSKGEQINYCNPKVPDRTCGSSLGCLYCMSTYNETTECYNQGNWPVCNTIVPDCDAFPGGNSTSLDSESPNLTVINPEEGFVYDKRSILLDLFIENEKADMTYYDNINGRGRWTNICKNCQSYSRKRSFKEGFNDITFRAEDAMTNEAFVRTTFYIDSKKPKITKTLPRRGFASGTFDVQFKEQNPETLLLKYGSVSTPVQTEPLNITEDCIIDRRRYNCEISANISSFDGQEIVYWFELTDLAGTFVFSRPKTLEVDISPPDINSLNQTIVRSGVEFTLDVTEPNFDEVEYIINQDTNPRARWRRFCSRLRDGICTKRVTLRNPGTYQIDIQVFDEAGNSVAQREEVIIV